MTLFFMKQQSVNERANVRKPSRHLIRVTNQKRKKEKKKVRSFNIKTLSGDALKTKPLRITDTSCRN